MFDLMNEISELVYVVDLETHELLFLNRAGKEVFGLDDLKGKICYREIQGLEHPCEFCSNIFLRGDSFYTWEFTNPIVQRHYLLKDKLIDWNGKKARMEIAFDMTASQLEKTKLKNSLDAENLVTECAKRLYSAGHTETVIGDVIELVGRFLEAERSYVFTIDGEIMDNTYEWCREDIAPQKDELQGLPLSLIDRWRDSFDVGNCVVIEDLENIKEVSPAEYETLSKQSIHSLIAAPMIIEGKMAGYLGVDNYAVDKLQNASSLLNSIGYFIGYVLSHQKILAMLEHLSYYDTLTGAMNRNAFMRDTNENACYFGDVGVVYIDVNGMKTINDNHGHGYGDQILHEIAQRIIQQFPEAGFYRIGGDEFIIICQSEGNKFYKRVQDLKNLMALEVPCDLAVGACWREGCRDIQDLIYEADEQMYTDKKNFYHGKALSGRYRHHMDDILGMTRPGALKRMINEGKFVVYYQPKISIAGLSMIGAEGLARCLTENGEIRPPDQFIPILEESRLISMLDFYIYETVCAQIETWLDEGLCVAPISVNFSRYSLSEENFAARLKTIWQKYRIPQALLEIEVTETVEADENCDFFRVIRQIKENGFIVSIDDFGVKNANLSLFTSAEFDVLKLDKSLISTLIGNERARAVIASISDICRRMKVKLIAEGVESEEQLEILREIKCGGAQGYLFSKPIPGDKFKEKYLS